jgi:RNA polymerase sigma-70 factor (ECF subfamily)
MDEAAVVAGLVQRLQAGDADAAALLFARYARQLTRLAEQHLSRKMAARLDGEDVVQSAFRTFFRRSAAGEFRIDSSAQLWRLLVRITVLKARARARQHTAARRDPGAEQPGGGEAGLLEAVTREPGPDYCQVLTLRLEGHAVAEIAPRLGVSRQTIYRALELLQRRLTDSTAADEA